MANMQPLIEAFADVVDSKGVKYFALFWNKSRQYIEKFWNQDEDKRLPVEFLMDAMEQTGIITPLERMADQLGYRLMPKQADPDGRSLEGEIIQGYEAVAAYLRAAKDDNIHYTDLMPLRMKAAKELDDVFKVARDRDHEVQQ